MRINERGITLIALVITIIILLILAGVALSLVVGDNGVLNKSMNAVDETNRAATQEQLELAISSVITDWFTDRAVDGSTPKLADYMTGEKVKAVMNNKYQLNEFILNTEKGVKVAYAGASYDFTVQITESGNGAKVFYAGSNGGNPGTGSGGTIGSNPIVPSELFEIGEAINVENYGKEVVGYKAKSSSGYSNEAWRLFYQDANYTYIIMDALVGGYKPSECVDDYQNGSAVGIVGRSLNRKLHNERTAFISSANKISIRMTAWLTDIDKWDNFKDDEGNAIYAIGSPTLDLIEASYNAFAQKNGIDATVTVIPSGSGYTATETPSDSVFLKTYASGIYNYNNSWYLIASPYTTSDCFFELAGSYPRLQGYCRSSEEVNVRPVACIPSSVFQNYSLRD